MIVSPLHTTAEGSPRIRARAWHVARLLLVALWIGSTGHPADAAQSGLQVTPDATRTLVSKDVGGERWAITRNADGTVTGNVFVPGGGPPLFVWCREQESPPQGFLSLDCVGADACPASGCSVEQWSQLGQVMLPLEFFQPEEATQLRGEGATMDEPRASGIQLTPDGRRTLISKDVGGERWAIVLDDDGTVTGNVFRPGGGDPVFVSCDEKARHDGASDYVCIAADSCRSGSCTAEQWQLAASISLPTEFFGPEVRTSHARITVPAGDTPDSVTADIGIWMFDDNHQIARWLGFGPSEPINVLWVDFQSTTADEAQGRIVNYLTSCGDGWIGETSGHTNNHQALYDEATWKPEYPANTTWVDTAYPAENNHGRVFPLLQVETQSGGQAFLTSGAFSREGHAATLHMFLSFNAARNAIVDCRSNGWQESARQDVGNRTADTRDHDDLRILVLPRAAPSPTPTTVVPTPAPTTGGGAAGACAEDCETAVQVCGEALFFETYETVADCTSECVAIVDDFASDAEDAAQCVDAQVRYIDCCTSRRQCGDIPDGCSTQFLDASAACGGVFGGCPLIFF